MAKPTAIPGVPSPYLSTQPCPPPVPPPVRGSLTVRLLRIFPLSNKDRAIPSCTRKSGSKALTPGVEVLLLSGRLEAQSHTTTSCECNNRGSYRLLSEGKRASGSKHIIAMGGFLHLALFCSRSFSWSPSSWTWILLTQVIGYSDPRPHFLSTLSPFSSHTCGQDSVLAAVTAVEQAVFHGSVLTCIPLAHLVKVCTCWNMG